MSLPPMNPELALLRRRSAQRKYIARLRMVRLLWAVAGGLLLLLTIEVLVALCFSPRFWITQVVVRNPEKLTFTRAEVLRLANIPPRSNYYRTSRRAIETRIAQDPRGRVDRVRVTQGVVGTLIISITERVPVCRLEGDKPYYLDARGVLFSRPRAPETPVPVVAGIPLAKTGNTLGKPVNCTQAEAVMHCLRALREQQSGNAPIAVARVELASDQRLTLVLRQGAKVYFGKAVWLDEKVFALYQIVVQASNDGYALRQIGYIDVRGISGPIDAEKTFHAAYFPREGATAAP